MGDVLLVIVCVVAVGMVLGASLWAGGHPKRKRDDEASGGSGAGDGAAPGHVSDAGHRGDSGGRSDPGVNHPHSAEEADGGQDSGGDDSGGRGNGGGGGGD